MEVNMIFTINKIATNIKNFIFKIEIIPMNPIRVIIF